MQKLLISMFLAAALIASGCSSSKSETPASKATEAKKIEAPAKSAEAPKTVAFRGIMTGSDVNLRMGPSTSSEVITMLDKNREVEVYGFLKTSGKYSWYKIKTPDNKVGFVVDTYLKPSEALDRAWENKFKLSAMEPQLFNAIETLQKKNPKQLHFRDPIIYYGLNHLTYYTYVSGGDDYNAIFTDFGLLTGLVITNKASSTYYWRQGEQLVKADKATLVNNLGEDLSPLMQ